MLARRRLFVVCVVAHFLIAIAVFLRSFSVSSDAFDGRASGWLDKYLAAPIASSLSMRFGNSPAPRVCPTKWPKRWRCDSMSRVSEGGVMGYWRSSIPPDMVCARAFHHAAAADKPVKLQTVLPWFDQRWSGPPTIRA